MNNFYKLAFEWAANISWMTTLPWAFLGAILAFLGNEIVKRRDHRIMHFSEEKRRVYSQIYGSLVAAADNLHPAFEIHQTLANRTSMTLKDRVYKLIASSELAGLPENMAELENILARNDIAAFERLCWAQLMALFGQTRAAGQTFIARSTEAEFLLRDRGTLSKAQAAHQSILEAIKDMSRTVDQGAFDALIGKLRLQIRPVRKELVADHDSDFTFRRFKRTDSAEKHWAGGHE